MAGMSFGDAMQQRLNLAQDTHRRENALAQGQLGVMGAEQGHIGAITTGLNQLNTTGQRFIDDLSGPSNTDSITPQDNTYPSVRQGTGYDKSVPTGMKRGGKIKGGKKGRNGGAKHFDAGGRVAGGASGSWQEYHGPQGRQYNSPPNWTNTPGNQEYQGSQGRQYNYGQTNTPMQAIGANPYDVTNAYVGKDFYGLPANQSSTQANWQPVNNPNFGAPQGFTGNPDMDKWLSSQGVKPGAIRANPGDQHNFIYRQGNSFTGIGDTTPPQQQGAISPGMAQRFGLSPMAMASPLAANMANAYRGMSESGLNQAQAQRIAQMTPMELAQAGFGLQRGQMMLGPQMQQALGAGKFLQSKSAVQENIAAHSNQLAQLRNLTQYTAGLNDKIQQAQHDLTGSDSAARAQIQQQITGWQTELNSATPIMHKIYGAISTGTGMSPEYLDQAMQNMQGMGDYEANNMANTPIVAQANGGVVPGYMTGGELDFAHYARGGAIQPTQGPMTQAMTPGTNPMPQMMQPSPMMGPQQPGQDMSMQQYGQYAAEAIKAGIPPLPPQAYLNLLARTRQQMMQAPAAQGGAPGYDFGGEVGNEYANGGPLEAPSPHGDHWMGHILNNNIRSQNGYTLGGGVTSQGYAPGGAIDVSGRQLLGPGTGKSDSLPAVIDGHRPAALSTGEFVMPIEAVKHFGTDKLHKMVQAAREAQQQQGR